MLLLSVQKENVPKKIGEQIKKGIENYRAAADAPARVDVYDVIEQIFANLNPAQQDAGKVSVDEISGCIRAAYYDRKEPAERTHKQMISTIMERKAFSVMEKPADGELDAGSNVTLMGRADRLEDEVVMIFRRVQELPEMPYADHFMQLNAYLHMFERDEGVIVYFDKDGNEIEFIVPRSKKLLEETFRRARILNTLLNNNVIPALEPSGRCLSCPYSDRCYYPSEDKQQWGFWARGKWRELKPKTVL